MFIASLVSAVSPDCDISMTRSFLPIIGSLYLNSDAISTVTLVLATFSIIYFPTIPAYIAVPQATTKILSYPASTSSVRPHSEKSTIPSLIRGVIVVLMAVGCSCISLSIKCSYPPFCAASASQSATCISFFTGSLCTSHIVTPSLVIVAISFCSRR